jgi:hypothetical protein
MVSPSGDLPQYATGPRTCLCRVVSGCQPPVHQRHASRLAGSNPQLDHQAQLKQHLPGAWKHTLGSLCNLILIVIGCCQQVFLPLIEPPPEGSPLTQCEAYIQTMAELTKELPPCALVADGEKTSVISTAI